MLCYFAISFTHFQKRKKCSGILIVWNLGAGYMGADGTIFSTCLYILHKVCVLGGGHQ